MIGHLLRIFNVMTVLGGNVLPVCKLQHDHKAAAAAALGLACTPTRLLAVSDSQSGRIGILPSCCTKHPCV